MSAVNAAAPPSPPSPASPPTVSQPAPVTVVVIDTRKTAQTLSGFGAATAYYQDWIAAHPYKREIYNALFRDLKLDILRLQNSYRGDPQTTFAADADIVRGARESLGHPITILMCAWSPSQELKSTKDIRHGGTLAKGSDGKFAYDAYAQFWGDSLAAYHRAGIDPAYVSIQNEPDWKADWESCLFTPSESVVNGVEYAGYDQALNAVSRRFSTLSHPPRLVGPETTGIADQKAQSFLPPDRAAEKGQLYAVAHHLYNGGKETSPDTFLDALHGLRTAFPDKPKWQTEFGKGDWFQTAWLIHNCLVEENVSAYLYWSALWPQGPETLMTMDDPQKPQTTWIYPHGWKVTPVYYALKHYSYFTAPGWTRIPISLPASANKELRVSAFVSPDGKKQTAVLLNVSSDRTQTLRLQFAGKPNAAHGSVFRSIENDYWHSLGTLPASGTLSLPPHSVVTVAWQ